MVILIFSKKAHNNLTILFYVLSAFSTKSDIVGVLNTLYIMPF